MVKLAIFDLDGTLVGNETLPFMVKAWNRLGYPKGVQRKVMLKISWYYLLYKLKISKTFDKQAFRTKAMFIFLELFKGMKEDAINRFFQECFDLLKNDFKEPILAELRKAQESGYTTVLLSGGFKGFVDIVGKYYGFDYAIGSLINYNATRLIDYSNPTDVNMGSMKVESIEKALSDVLINWDESIAYADSYYDLDILNKVMQPVAVSPDDKLKEYAHEKKWRIIL